MARKRKKKKECDGAKASYSAARKAYLANGGTLASCGRPARFTDRKKAARKAACRQPVHF